MEVTHAADLHVGFHAGTPNWVIRKVHFHDFAGLPTTRGTGARTHEFSCFGHRWGFTIYPGGLERSKEGYVGAFLFNNSSQSIEACYKIVVKHPTDQAETIIVRDKWTFESVDSGGGAAGVADMTRRETLLEYLIDGTLTLEVHLGTNRQSKSTSFLPSNPLHDNILKGFNNEEKSDVKFVVGGEAESAPNRRKRAKNASTTFHASHAILDLVAPALADMCEPGNKAAAVPVNGVEPEVFRMLLYFCYGGTVSDDELGANAKAIIESADRFGIVNLKLKAEVALAEQTKITVDNMLDNLLYAHSKNLALFQEMIMDFVAANGDKIIGNVSFSNVPGELMSDLLTATTRGNMSTGKAASEDDLKFSRVGELRKRLHDKGLCIDGSRETMIALLKANTEHDGDDES